jgi:hypothetical protein
MIRYEFLHTDMDREAAKNALLSARAAWHKAIDARDEQWTPDAHNEEWRTIHELERAIRAYQVFVPGYDPKKMKGYYAYGV